MKKENLYPSRRSSEVLLSLTETSAILNQHFVKQHYKEIKVLYVGYVQRPEGKFIMASLKQIPGTNKFILPTGSKNGLFTALPKQFKQLKEKGLSTRYILEKVKTNYRRAKVFKLIPFVADKAVESKLPPFKIIQ